mmetsp:Transcript_4156/g.10576  ORF Transcript_4156/g.10576 Transcript_4156/m.10576 type:complete len:241 (-) Transcript_4156:912-1634(-)
MVLRQREKGARVPGLAGAVERQGAGKGQGRHGEGGPSDEEGPDAGPGRLLPPVAQEAAPQAPQEQDHGQAVCPEAPDSEAILPRSMAPPGAAVGQGAEDVQGAHHALCPGSRRVLAPPILLQRVAPQERVRQPGKAGPQGAHRRAGRLAAALAAGGRGSRAARVPPGQAPLPRSAGARRGLVQGRAEEAEDRGNRGQREGKVAQGPPRRVARARARPQDQGRPLPRSARALADCAQGGVL